MKTSNEIQKLLSGRGNSFNPSEKFSDFTKTISDIEVCNKLFPLKRARKYNYNNFVGCDKRNLEKQNETAFSRALYNQGFLSLGGELAVILDYEVPLSKDNSQKVDLLAYKPLSNSFVAVEYKIKPDNASTTLEYGLFESYCYGYLLDKILLSYPQTITNELNNLLKSRGLDYIKKLIPNTKPSAEFIIAAPVSYFSEFIKAGDKAVNRFKRILEIEKVLKEELNMASGVKFSGYYLLSEVSHKSVKIVEIKKNNVSYPFLMCLVDDIELIRESIK